MVRITAEILPGGSEHGKKTLGVCEIANTGQGTPTRGEYRYRLYGKAGKIIGQGMIHDFPRKAKLAWDLLKRVLDDAKRG